MIVQTRTTTLFGRRFSSSSLLSSLSLSETTNITTRTRAKKQQEKSFSWLFTQQQQLSFFSSFVVLFLVVVLLVQVQVKNNVGVVVQAFNTPNPINIVGVVRNHNNNNNNVVIISSRRRRSNHYSTTTTMFGMVSGGSGSCSGCDGGGGDNNNDKNMKWNENKATQEDVRTTITTTSSISSSSTSTLFVLPTTIVSFLFGMMMSTISMLPEIVYAKTTTTPSSIEIQTAVTKLENGYDRLNYLLDHWIEETTICGKGDDNPYNSYQPNEKENEIFQQMKLKNKQKYSGTCERSPNKVMDYLGYRNINDPLYRADKTMQRIESLIPMDQYDSYVNSIEQYIISSEEGNSMSFISSWGEANPGGGKDRVTLFIERSKQNVIDTKNSIGTVLSIIKKSEQQ